MMEKLMARKRKGLRVSEKVQLNQLKKKTFPGKNSNQMGLDDVKTIKGFWNVFDNKYYNALAKTSVEFAIEDVKSLDRENRGFLQEMRRRINTHKKHMDKSNMEHHITSNDIVKKHWVPLLT